MGKEIVSKVTRREFREWLVGTYVAYIQGIFDDAGVECDEDYVPRENGQRRCLVEQYYHTVDWTNQAEVRCILNAYEAILIGMPDESRAKYCDFLARDGFLFDGTRILPAPDPLASGERLQKIGEDLDIDIIAEQVARIKSAVLTDPALAIGTSKELLESICKGIICGCGSPLRGNEDLPGLVKLCLQSMKMAREDTKDEQRGAEARRQIASGLAAACQGIAELRNVYGTGHGRGPNAGKPFVRDANLAVGAAMTLGLFLAEVYNARRQKRAAEARPGVSE